MIFEARSLWNQYRERLQQYTVEEPNTLFGKKFGLKVKNKELLNVFIFIYVQRDRSKMQR